MTDENSVSDLLDKYIKPSSVRESKAHHQNAALLHDSHATYTTHIPVPIIVATDKEAALALSRLSQHYAKSLEYFINETADAEGKGHDLLKEDASVHEASRIRASFSGEPGGNAEVKSESSGVSVKELPPALAPNEVISAHRSPQDSTVTYLAVCFKQLFTPGCGEQLQKEKRYLQPFLLNTHRLAGLAIRGTKLSHQ